MRQTLSQLDIEPDRVQMFNLSSAMGPRFAEIAAQMTADVKRLGPSPLNHALPAVA